MYTPSFQVMAIVPTHFIWQRERAEHHSGAQRFYIGDREKVHIPRGPSASPAPCALCAKSSGLGLSSSSDSGSSTSLSSSPLPFALALSLETTPPRSQASSSRRPGEKKTKVQTKAQRPCCCTEEAPSECRRWLQDGCAMVNFLQFC